MLIKDHLIPCKHCNESGTCKSGKDEKSCIKCSRLSLPWLLQFIPLSTKGAICSACKGSSKIEALEPYSVLLNQNILPILGATIIIGAPITLHAFQESPHFPEILSFVATISGSAVTYFFHGKHSKRRPRAQ